MSKAHELGQLGHIVSVSDGISTTVSVSGIISATSFVGDGASLENTGAVVSAGATVGTQRVALTDITSGIMTSAATDSALVYEPSTGTLSATSFSGDGSNITNAGATLSATSGTERVVLTNLTSGAMTASSTDSNLTFDASTGTLSATNFSGDGANLSNTGAIVSAGVGTQRVALTDITSGIMTSAATDSALAYDSSTGTLSATAFSGNGANLSNTGATLSAASGVQRVVLSSLTSGVMTTAATDANLTYDEPTNTLTANIDGQAGVLAEYTLGADSGNTYYTFTGPGFDGTEQNPDLFLIRGQKYRFINNMGAHPFRIQSSSLGTTPAVAYNDGLSDNIVDNGIIEWDVQNDAPSTLYYQCTSHTNMQGTIYIFDPSNPPTSSRIAGQAYGTDRWYIDVSGAVANSSGFDYSIEVDAYRGGSTYGNHFKIYSDTIEGPFYTADFSQVSLTCGDNGSIYMGKYAGYKLSKYSYPAENNVILGAQALRYNQSGRGINESVFIGARSGKTYATTNSVMIGYEADHATSSGSGSAGTNNIIIGYQAKGTNKFSSNEITLGNSSIASLRCNVQTISSLSDRRDKTNIENIPVGLNYINALRPVKFDWARRDGSYEGKKAFGFIAQELDEVQEQFGYGEYTNLTYHADPNRLEASPMNSYPILVKAVQELSQQNQDLLRRIEELENRLNNG